MNRHGKAALACGLTVLVLMVSSANADLVAHWAFDEGQGNIAYDSFGGFDGAIHGAQWTDGQVGGALHFSGNGAYVRTSYMAGPDEYTISLWYNLNEDIETADFYAWKALVSKTGDETHQVELWNVWFHYDDGLRLQNERTESHYAIVGYLPPMFYAHEWHHVVVTGSTAEGKIYVDGVLRNTSNDNFVTGAWNDSVPFDIGRAHLGISGRYFNGKIDEVMVFDTVLPDTEIQQLYQNGLNGNSSSPPVADANGPYTLHPGDTLTLDASGSTDDENDITSYVWDLNDDGVFETDAGTQAIFDVSYAYLEALGILVGVDYDIHLKVIDGDEQADTDSTTLTIDPKPALVIAVDIKPTSCPNPLNVKSKGVLSVAILGSDIFDATTIDATSIRLKGVAPIRHSFEDVAAPGLDVADCNCIEDGPDGFVDLTLKFKTQQIVEALGEVDDGDIITLELTGVLFDEIPIEGADCILIRGRHKPINPADISKDGVVNAADFAIFVQNWLQSSIVDD